MHLETDRLTKHFGGIAALDEVSLDFLAGRVTAIIGPNGAGKTTLFNIIGGFLQPDDGAVNIVRDQAGSRVETKVVGLLPHEVAHEGVGVLFQDVRVFKRLSVLENVAVAAVNQTGENPLRAIFQPSRVRTQDQEVHEKARRLLEHVGLAGSSHLDAEQLSYGQQKLLGIARLLAQDAKVLLLDEPTAGVHPDMVDRLLSQIQRLAHEEGRAVVMIEHNLNVVRRAGDWVYLMADGRVEVFGRPDEVLRNAALFEVFPTL